MASLLAQYTNVNSLIANFIEQDLPYFAVLDKDGNLLKKNFEIDDVEESSTALKKFIQNIDPSNRMQFTIKHFATAPAGGKYKKTDEPDAVSTFKMKLDPEEVEQKRSTYYEANRILVDEIRELRNEINAMRLQNAIEDDADDDDETTKQASAGGIIGEIIGHPAIQSVLVQLLTNITANLATPKTQSTLLSNTPPVRAMAGIEPNEQQILDLMFAKGITWSDLQLLANMPAEKITFLLNMLRNGL